MSTTGAGLVVSSRLSFATQRITDRKSAPYWKPVMTGFGAYAEVFRIRESVHHDSIVLSRTPLARSLVAKVFRDAAPNDYESVYGSELHTLLTLGHHERIVGVRGAADIMPPNFVCGHIDCGQAFQVERCPQCEQPLRNGDSSDIILVCSSGHRYQKHNPDHLRLLTHQRPCRHQDDCTPINFLFRPYILLEELDHDLRTVNDLLTSPGLSSSTGDGPAINFETKPDTDERRRELLLFRLDSLIGVAEGLAFLHSKGCLHADVAPDNAMIRLGTGIDGQARMAGQATTKLIDFGLAKRVEDNRTTTTVVGRITFLAPEQMVAQGSLGPKVSIRFRNGTPQEGEFCQIVTVNGDELPFERRDYLKDVEDGQYEIVTESEIPNEIILQLADGTTQDSKNPRGRAMHARILKPPMTGRDTAQTTLRFSYALDFPTDIFSLGCLIGWSITGGQEDLVHLMREQANVATRRREVVTPGYCMNLFGEDFKKIANAIDLPRTAEDEELKKSLLDVICRSLIRSEGAYCRRRSSGYNQPAVALATDLRRIRNSLFLMVHTQEELSRYADQQATSQANYVANLTNDVQRLDSELARKDDLVAKLTRKTLVWQITGIAGVVSSLCLSLLLRSSAASGSPDVLAVGSSHQGTERQGALPASPEPPNLSLNEPPLSAQVPPTEKKNADEVKPTDSPLLDTNVPGPQPEREEAPRSSDNVPSGKKGVRVTAGPKALTPPPRASKTFEAVVSGERAISLFQKSCSAAAASIKPEGQVYVKYEFDVATKKVKSVTFLRASKGLTVAEENCVRVLRSVDFSGVKEVPMSFEASYTLGSVKQGGL